MPISDDVIHQIKDTVDIVSLIDEYIPLKKAGKNYKTKCPFHEDNTPSFYVSPELKIFHCFGCGKSGDIISFIMDYEKVPFYEALRILAHKACIELKEFGDDNQILYSVHEFAVDFYHQYLMQSEKVLDYLHRRGLNEDIIKKFKLGFAPSGSRFYKRAKKDFKERDLLKSGLVKEKKGKLMDRFYLRLLFPIYSSAGKIIGFGGRRLSKSGPKYLNSPDTPIHKKGRNLYSVWHTKEEIRSSGSVVLVEGYFDFISLYQAGIRNTVACLGTALTEDQAELLSRYAKEVIMFFDRDAAGKAATLRSLGMLLDKGADVKIGSIESGKDPDDIIKKEGKKGFELLINNADDCISFVLNRIMDEYDLSKPFGLSKAVEEILSILKQIKDPVKLNIYREIISKRLMIKEDMLDVRKSIKSSVKTESRNYLPENIQFELSLLYAMMRLPNERDTIFSMIKDEDISNLHLRKAFRVLKEGREIELADFSDSLSERMIDYLMKESSKPSISAIYIGMNLKKYLLNKEIEEKKRKLHSIEESGENGESLLKEIRDLVKERENLSKEKVVGS